MTPEERANKVREIQRESCDANDCDYCAEVLALLPPGSIILTPDEIETISRPLRWHTEEWMDLWMRLRGGALSLLGGGS